MKYILLSGGSGSRLWPLSNGIRSKQFINIFPCGNGEYESMLQRVYRQIRETDPDADVTIATAKPQVSSILNQLGSDVGISVEPCRRDTFPAIVLACEYLVRHRNAGMEEHVAICPVDPYVGADYFSAVGNLPGLLNDNDVNLALLGICPVYPSEKYGYILPETNAHISRVRAFKEKPSKTDAEKYIAEGGLWNAGVFVFQIGWLLERARGMIGYRDYEDLLDRYESLDKISFDYAVVEKEQGIRVMRYSGEWKDLGTWNTLVETMGQDIVGNAVLGSECSNVNVINELSIPILTMGMKDAVVAASPDGILVTDKEQSSYIKPYVDRLRQQVMYAEKSWGEYRVLDIAEDSMTVRVTLRAGSGMNYHSHEHRDEIWNVVSGTGRVVVDGVEKKCSSGDVIRLPVRCRHTVLAETDLQIVEVQLGHDIRVEDKVKYPLNV